MEGRNRPSCNSDKSFAWRWATINWHVKTKALQYNRHKLNQYKPDPCVTRLTPWGATSGAGNAYPSGAYEFTPGFQWGSCYSICSFLCRFLYIVVCSFVILSSNHCDVCSHYCFGICKLFHYISLPDFQLFFFLNCSQHVGPSMEILPLSQITRSKPQLI